MNDILWPLASVGIIGIIVLIGVLTIRKIFKEAKSGFPSKDERTQKITRVSATYAFFIGLFFMVALMLLNILSNEFLGGPLLDTGYALIAPILVNSLTFLIVHWYFNRKGDV